MDFQKNSCPSPEFILGGSATAIFVLKSKSAMPESVHSCPTSFGDVVQFWLLEFYNNEATLKPTTSHFLVRLQILLHPLLLLNLTQLLSNVFPSPFSSERWAKKNSKTAILHPPEL